MSGTFQNGVEFGASEWSLLGRWLHERDPKTFARMLVTLRKVVDSTRTLARILDRGVTP